MSDWKRVWKVSAKHHRELEALGFKERGEFRAERDELKAQLQASQALVAELAGVLGAYATMDHGCLKPDSDCNAWECCTARAALAKVKP